MRIKNLGSLVLSSMILFQGNWSFSGEPRPQFQSVLKKEISKQFGNAEINFIGSIQWVRGSAPKNFGEISIYGDDSKGNIHFAVENLPSRQESEGWLKFSAWLPARIALKRILPGQSLSSEYFTSQRINVSTGMGREYRGSVFPEGKELSGLESTQTILEGQFLTSSSVQIAPDVRRGDSVRIQLVSGDLTLSTLGTASEPGHLGRQLRVITLKGKRELFGSLKPGKVVEVDL